MANRWLQRFAAVLPGAGSFFSPTTAAGTPKPPSAKELQTALAIVDPLRSTVNWNITAYNPSWLVTRKGLQIYDQMRRDEQVKAALKFKKDSVLGSGWEVVSPRDQEEDWEVTRFVRDVFEHIGGGWNQVLVNILGALDYGYSVGEKIYGEEALGEWKGKLALKRIQSLRPHYIDFASDPYGKLEGIIQRMVEKREELLPPAKFIVYTNVLEFGNYYGTSDLEAAYRAWWVKDNSYKWLAVSLERFGLPPLFALYDGNAYRAEEVTALKKIVKGIQNATFGIIPRPSKDALEFYSQKLGGEGTKLFLSAMDRFDQHITRALLVPSLIGVSADEGRTGSLARSEQHAASFLQVVSQLQQDVAASAVNSQIIPQLCDLNYPGLDSYPLFRFLPFTDEKRLEVVKTWTELVSGQVVNKIEDDETHIRKVMGFPENDTPTVLPNPAAKDPAEGQDPAVPDEKKQPPANEKDTPAQPDVTKLVPKEKQSKEMQQFAEENFGVWVYADDGQMVCVAEESIDA